MYILFESICTEDNATDLILVIVSDEIDKINNILKEIPIESTCTYDHRTNFYAYDREFILLKPQLNKIQKVLVA